MARVAEPDFVALQVRELGASARFYEQKLRLKRAPQSPPDAVVFATEPIAFAVREPLVDLEAVEKLGWGVALWMGCDDAQEPFDGPLGRTFAFVGPDGYRVTVHDGR